MSEAPKPPAGWRILSHDRLDSTNDEMKRLARAGAAAGTVVWAREQFAGRGRRQGRSWIPVPGNLYASFLLRPDCAPPAIGQIGFVAAVAAGEALLEVVPTAALAYKWPNDVLIRGRKLVGILCEAEIGARNLVDWVVVGIGVNLAGHPPATRTPATSLAGEGCPGVTAATMLEHLAACLAGWFERWRRQGFEPVRAAWIARAHGLGAAMLVEAGKEELRGRFDGLDRDGALLLATASGARRIVAGEIVPAQD